MIRRVEQRWVSLVRGAGFIVVLLTAGCAGTNGMDRAPQKEPAKPGVAQDGAPAPESQQPEARERRVRAKPAPPPAAPPLTASTSQGVVKAEAPVAKQEPPAAKPEAPVAKPEAPVAKPETPATTPPAQVAASPAPAAPAPKKEAAAAAPAPKPAAPPLDLKSLEKRLKDTNAIGVFTKLTLKNQVDALLEKFRGYYQGRIKTTLDQLRQPYDQLLMKVLSLLQDTDPPLARDIVQSREAIWGILTDPKKFSEL